MLFLKKYVGFRFNLKKNRNLNFTCHEFHITALQRKETKLSSREISDILRANEYSHDFGKENRAIKFYDSNQLPANVPIEDTRTEVKCLLNDGILIGVFDGHGGPACAHVVADRLPSYICAGLLPNSLLEHYLKSIQGNEPTTLIERFNRKYKLVPELQELHRKSFIRYVNNLLDTRKQNFSVEEILEKAMLSLDEDISTEASNLRTINIAMTGAVGCLAYIEGPHLYIANVGDCRAVLGALTEDNKWIVKKFTNDHNCEDKFEKDRINNEHPSSESKIICRGRLLGQLAPSRAFGDVSYKWSQEKLLEIAMPLLGSVSIPSNYLTPPYLTAKPEITYHRLTPGDKFLIIASDGFWENIGNEYAVRLVGEHISGKMVLNPFEIPNNNPDLRQINELLLQRKEYLNFNVKDSNAATHLLRNALGGNNYDALSKILTHPDFSVRSYRDDITISVVFFDSEYLKQVNT